LRIGPGISDTDLEQSNAIASACGLVCLVIVLSFDAIDWKR